MMFRSAVAQVGGTALAALVITGCGGDETVTAPTMVGSCTTEAPLVEIIDNHRTSGGDHILVVTVADVLAGVTKTYDIRGDNIGHTHTVTITADQFALLQAGTAIVLTSSDTGAAGSSHTHEINISCR